MDKMTFASYKFKPSDVIEGLNRYFAETKAYRYLRAALEIRRGVCYNNPDCVKDIVFTSSPYEARSRLVRDAHYLICDPEEVVGVAINWLREEHDIFYTPGMEVPVEDFDVDEAAKEYEKETRKDRVEELRGSWGDITAALQKRLSDAKRRIAELEKELAKKDARINGLKGDVDLSNRLVKEQREFITKVAELLETKDPYIEREYAHAIDVLSNIVKYPNLHRWRYNDLKGEILKVYREIFDCSNGDPEGSDAETLQDILTEYKRVLELKNMAEEKTIKYKELARENEEKLAKEKEWTKRLEQKLIEIQDVCER